MSKSRDYLDKRLSRGLITFSTDEFAKELELSQVAATHSLLRLRKNKLIASPIKGFHVILDPSDKKSGSRPPDEFIHYLMSYLSEPYYVSLLSAAEIHGAAHHRPQVFQVMVKKNRRMVRCGNVRIQFTAKANLEKFPTSKHKVMSGYITVSTPEVTAFDLVGYDNKAAGLDSVATVLNELAENLAPKKLAAVSELFEITWLQRLGYILQFLKKKNLSEALAPLVIKRARKTTPLLPGKPVDRCEIANQWKVIVNERLEPDL